MITFQSTETETHRGKANTMTITYKVEMYDTGGKGRAQPFDNYHDARNYFDAARPVRQAIALKSVEDTGDGSAPVVKTISTIYGRDFGGF